MTGLRLAASTSLPKHAIEDLEGATQDVRNAARILQDLGKAHLGKRMEFDRVFGQMVYLGYQLEQHANVLESTLAWAGEA